MATDASDMFWQMDRAIEEERHLRVSDSPNSPQQNATLEAEPGRVFTLSKLWANVPGQRPFDLRWAAANTLHFFACTEDASMLHRYNKHAKRFAPGGKWVGAYGAIAGPQLAHVCEELIASPNSRRAIVSMGQMRPMDLNRPACWNHLHFLKWRDRLDLLVEQRSLNLHGVMAYDLVVLTNLLTVVAHNTGITAGSLRWRIGSLHKLDNAPKVEGWLEPSSCLMPIRVLSDPHQCMDWLNNPGRATGIWRDVLTGDFQ